MKLLNNVQFKDILLNGGYVSPEDIEKAEKHAKKHKVLITDYLLSQGVINKDLLGQAIAEFFGVPYADLNSNQPSREQVLNIPEKIAVKYRIVLFKDSKNERIVSTDDPKQNGIDEVIKKLFKTGKTTIMYSLSEDIDGVFMYYRKALETRFTDIIEKRKSVAPEILKEIIEDALVYRTSDIHFEPQEKETLIRFRVDGVLHEAGRIPNQYYENILNRIKIQADLRIDEHHRAQDGAIRLKKDGLSIDMRVSIVPVISGEKVVIRLLAEYVKGFTLEDLGLSVINQKYIEKASKKPFGMVLVTGPTGSGKTTTLYALLKLLNRPEVNITTIEDPVEYRLDGGNQIQVNAKTGLTFAQGLRSVVRQDPDIILVGEIRDEETAEISVNAALTGHLLFSTFHANDASSTVPRLFDMGIEPFLLSSTLELIVAQRLVRQICEECRYSYSEDFSAFNDLFPEVQDYFGKKTVTLYKGKGCGACGGVGYKGRTTIMEVIASTSKMRKLILTKPSADEISKLAKEEGALTLLDDGVEKVKKGVTSLEELLRVVSPSN
jgi:type IV pilus assembly protein PilB